MTWPLLRMSRNARLDSVLALDANDAAPDGRGGEGS